MNLGDKLQFKAKCPHCETGCDKCDDGYCIVTFGEVDDVMYSIVCKDCNANVGGGFIKPYDQPPKLSPYTICPFCDTHNLQIVGID